MIVGPIRPMPSPNVAVLYLWNIIVAPFGEECNRTNGPDKGLFVPNYFSKGGRLYDQQKHAGKPAFYEKHLRNIRKVGHSTNKETGSQSG